MRARFLFLLSLTAILISCSDQVSKNKDSIRDSVQIAQQIKDSLQYLKDSLENKALSAEDYKKIQQEYIDNYKKINIIDTSFKDENNKVVRVFSKYYCLFDNGVVVPGRYNWQDSTKDFTTHNYADGIIIIVDKDTIFNKIVTKKDFNDSLYPELQKYAVMYDGAGFDGYDKENKLFKFSYSVSIPVTDVGTAIFLLIDKKGNSRISLR